MRNTAFLIVALLSCQPAWAGVELTVGFDWEASGVPLDANARLGESVGYAGDVNGDGYGDVIAGAYLDNQDPTYEGRVYVFYGGASGLPETPDRTLLATPTASRHFGTSVSGAGDVNGDGYDDVIVGAPLHTNPDSGEGAAIVYLGSETGVSPTHAWIVEGNSLSARLGQSVAAAGDVNGDGYDDVIVGAHQFSNGELNEGVAFVFLGSDTGLSSTPQATLEGDQAGADFGWSVAGAGDVNGDGYDDVVVGAPEYANGEASEGRVLVFPGSATGVLTTPILDMESDQAGGNLGFSVTGAGDMNADGYADIAAGARYYSDDDPSEGRVFIILGESSYVSPVVQFVDGNQSTAYLGWSVSGGGDFNHDGYDDLLAGAVSWDNGAGDNGAAMLFLGSADGVITTPALIVAREDTVGDQAFGTSVALVGSVNADQWDDLVIGDPLWDSPTENTAGMAFGVYGREIALNPASEWWDTNPDDQPNDQLGLSVADAGDVNGDGFDDVIVGQQYYDNEVGNEGAAYLYLGSPGGLSDFDGLPIERDNNITSAYFGYAVAGAGDVNQDGFDDVLIGAPRQQGAIANAGAVYLYTGSETGLSTTEFHVFEGDESGAMYGSSVDAGDFNNDGYRDVVIGAHFYDDPEINEGAVLIYYGSESGFATTADAVISLDQGNRRFGQTVANAGDVNGDGYDDLLVSAPDYLLEGDVRSAVFLFLGSEAGLGTTDDWRMVGGYGLALLGGGEVSSAGDVNGDGYDDILVGTDYANVEGVRLFLGSPSGPALAPDWTRPGYISNGAQVAAAGDVNQDGFDDLIIGDTGYDGFESDSGTAFIFLGNADGLPTPSSRVEGFRPPEYVSVGLYFATGVSGAGDINGDGADDIVAGQPFSAPGVVFAYHGLPKDAYLRGTVVDAADGVTPVHPVGIDLIDPATGEYLYSVSNNPDGSYEFADIEPGDYLVFFNAYDTANHFVDELYDEEPCVEGYCDAVARGTPATVELGANTLDEDLSVGTRITGTVTEAGSGVPIQNLEVGFYDTAWAQVFLAVTAADGSYDVSGLPVQDYYVVADGSTAAHYNEVYDDVRCSGTDCAPVADSATLVNAGAGGTAVADFVLDPDIPATISGNITGSDTGLPVENITLWLFDTDCNYINWGLTDASGDYTVEAGDPGEFYLFAVANEAFYIDQQSPYINQQYPGIDMHDTCYPLLNDVTLGEVIAAGEAEQVTSIDFVLNPGATIRGTISDGNGVLPAQSAYARLYSLDGTQQYLALNREPDGSYRFGGIMPGTWHMVLGAGSNGLIDERYDDIACPRNSCDSALGMEITVAAGDEITGVDAVLETGAVISGTVTDRESGLPVEGVCMWIYTETGVYAANSCTDASGNFTTGMGLPPGNYRLSNQLKTYYLRNPDGGYEPQMWTSDGSYAWCGEECDFSQGDTFTVVDTTAVENIDLAMYSSASLSGTVVSAADGTTPVSPVSVQLWTPDGIFTGMSADTAPDGTFEITGIDPGDYKVLFDAYGAAVTYRDEVYSDVDCVKGSCPVADIGQVVTLDPGPNTLDEDLTPGGAIAGVISSSATGQPLGLREGSARLYLLDGTLVATALTNANGAYTLGGLTSGSYYVVLTKRFGNLVDELYDDVKCPRLSCDTSAGTVVVVTDDVVTPGIDATLDPGSRITGHFLHPDGSPVPAYTALDVYTAAGVRAGYALTDESGFYETAAGFPAGDYYVAQFNQGFLNTSYPNVPCGDPCDPTVGQLVTVDGVNDATGIDFLAVPNDVGSSVVYGTVVADDGGAPIDDVKICAVSQSDGSIKDCDITGAFGTYLIGGLPLLSDYAVYTEDVGGQAFFLEVYDGLDCCDTSAGTPVDLSLGNAEVNFSLAASGLITGQVLSSLDDAPIPNVDIWLFDADCNLLTASATQTSDEEMFLGMYAISGVPDGTWYVFARGQWQGYVNELYPDEKRMLSCAGALDEGQAIIIEGHNQVSGIDFALDPAGSISGTVSDANGILPRSSARLRLYEPGSRTLLLTVRNWNWDNTYTVPGLPPGEYDLVLTSQWLGLVGERYDDVPCPANSCDLTLGERIVVGPQEHVTGIDAVLDAGAVITGTLTDADTGVGLPNMFIDFYTTEGVYAGYGRSDADGNYTSIVGFPEGEYYATNTLYPNPIEGGYLPQAWTQDGTFIDCGVPCDVTLGDTFTVTGTDGIVIDLAMQKGAVISGNVQFDGSPQANVSVMLLSNLGLEIATTQTDAVGDYRFEGLTADAYYVRTLNGLGYADQLFDLPANEVCSPDCNPFAGTLVEPAPASEVTGIDFNLNNGASILGTVTDGELAPMAGVKVEAYDLQANLVSSTLTALDGSYEIGGLGEGTYFVRTRNQAGLLDRLYGGLVCGAGCDERDGDPVIVPVGLTDATNIDIQLLAGGVLSGTVLGDDGGQLVPLAGVPVRAYTSSGAFAFAVLTDINGEYLVEGLSADDYHVLANGPREGRGFGNYVGEDLAGNFCQQNCDPLTTATVSVPQGVMTNVDFELQKGQPIRLKIRDSIGNLVTTSLIAHVYDLAGNLVRTSHLPTYKKAGTKGEPPPEPEYTASLNNLAPGEYFIDIAGGNYQAEIYDDVTCYYPCDPTVGTRVTVTEDPPTEVLQVTLQASNTISGSVYLAGSDPLEGVGGINVSAYTDTGLLLRTVTTAADGSYAIEGLPNGSYRLQTSGWNDYVDQVYNGDDCTPDGCDLLNGTAILLNSFDATNRNFLVSAGGTISGYAKDSGGNPVYGRAYLYDAAGEQVDSVSMQTSGLFIFRGIADGTYYVYVDAQSTRVYAGTSCHYHYYGFYRERHCWSNYRYTSSIDTVYSGVDCPNLSCDVTTGTPVVLGPAAAGAAAPMAVLMAEEPAPSSVNIEMSMSDGYLIRGTVRNYLDEPLAFARLYFFDENGNPAGSTVTDGNGEYVSESGLPNGTYFAATSRAAIPSDTPPEAEDAEGGIGQGLQDEIYGDVICDAPCAPSLASGIGTPIVISGSDAEGINLVLGRAPGISVEKLTNGVDADTPNGGEAPEIAAGETVNWTYEVTNTGGVELIDISVIDDQGVSVSCPGTTLAADASITCTASDVALDLSQDPFNGVLGNCGGRPNSRLYQNTATVTARTGAEDDVEGSDRSHYCNPRPKEDLIFSDGFE
jgi:hypothetical protein